jgi:hypothetical protein
MNDTSIEYLKLAVEGLHKCTAKFKEKTHVIETFEGETVWDDDVYIFEVEGIPNAKICYAWSSPISRSDQKRYHAVLHRDQVKSVQDAVRASIFRDNQKGEK